MSKTCTFYENTGLEAGEIIDSPAKLASISTVVHKKNLQIITNAWLAYVLVESDAGEAPDVDFIKVGKDETVGEKYDWYYKVIGFEPVTDTTFKFYLNPLGILIAGGIDQLASIEGVAVRYNVTDDTFGEYCLDDEYTAPAEPLEVEEGYGSDQIAKPSNQLQLVASTLELMTQGVVDHIHIPTFNKSINPTVPSDYAAQYLDGVNFYKAIATPYTTTFYGPWSSTGFTQGGMCLYQLRGTGEDTDSKSVKRGIEAARSIGAESGILASYKIPLPYVGFMESQRIYMEVDSAYENTASDMVSNISNIPLIGNIGAEHPDVGHVETFTAPAEADEDPEADIITPGPIFSVSTKDLFGILGKASTTYIKSIHGGSGRCTYGCPRFKYKTDGYTPINKRVYYGSYQPYVIASIAGNQKQYNAEQLYGGDYTLSPDIYFISDPRPDGTVYYYFKHIYGEDIDKSAISRGVLLGNIIPSLQWDSIPLNYTDVSGGKLNQQTYTASRASSDLSYNQKTRGFLNKSIMSIGDFLGGTSGGQDNDISPLLSFIGNTAGAGAGVASTSLDTIATTGVTAAASGVGSIAGGGAIAAAAAAALPVIAVGAGAAALGAQQYSKLAKVRENYLLDTNIELSQYLSTNNVVAPVISFPPNVTLARQIYGEQPICYRYRYSDNDVKRIDKILTMYGYKVCEPADISMLTSHQTFNYFQGSVKVKGKNHTLPSWLSEMCSAELSAGVRIWHQKPIKITADCNPVKK